MDVTGTIATEPEDGGSVAVILVDAVIEPILEGQVTEMTPRKLNAQQVGSGQSATRSESKLEDAEKFQPDSQGRSR